MVKSKKKTQAKGISKRMKNLVPLTEMRKESAKKIRQKGAEASNKVQREKKTFKEIAKQILAMKANKKTIKKLSPFFPDMTEEEIDIRIAIIGRQAQKAIGKGDTKAATFLRDSAGEMPASETRNLNYNADVDLTDFPIETLEIMSKMTLEELTNLSKNISKKK